MDQIFGGFLHKLMFLISLVFYSEKRKIAFLLDISDNDKKETFVN